MIAAYWRTPTLIVAAALLLLCSDSGLAQTAPAGQTAAAVFTVLTPYGFEPAVLRAAAGRTVVVVYNRTGLRQPLLRLERETGVAGQPNERVKETRLAGSARRWYERFDLMPGQYVLTEAGHPKWVCRLTVSPAGN